MSEAVAPSGRRLLVACAAAALTLSWLLPLHVTWSSAPDLGHAWVVPVLMAYLYWERWDERPAALPRAGLGARWWFFGAILVAAHLPLRLLLTPFPLWPSLLGVYLLLLVLTALAGAWLIAGRAGVRWTAGPLILLVSTLPVPSALENAIILPLRQTWASLAAEISNLLGTPALALGTSVRIGNGWVGVDDACGGIRSLQACAMIALFFGEWYRFSVLRRLGLLGIGLAAALLGNFARVVFLSLRASASPEALEKAHDIAGWAAMAASMIATGWLALHWNKYQWPSQQVRSARASHAPTNAQAWFASIALLFCLNELAARVWFALGERRTAETPQWTAAMPSDHWSFRPSTLPKVAREMLRPDVFEAGTWLDGDERVYSHYIEWRKGQVARSIPFLHNPTVCLPLSGCELIESLGSIAVTWRGGQLPFHVYKFRRSGEEILVAFTIWDPSRGRPLQEIKTQSWAEWWSMQWGEVREARRHQPGQLLSVTLPWHDTTGPSRARSFLEKLVVSVGDRPPIQPSFLKKPLAKHPIFTR